MSKVTIVKKYRYLCWENFRFTIGVTLKFENGRPCPTFYFGKWACAIYYRSVVQEVVPSTFERVDDQLVWAKD